MSDTPTYVVTGATGGLGKAIVKELASRPGARIVMAVRNPQRALDYAESLGADGCEFRAVRLDLESIEGTEAAARSIIELGWSIDALINNAGVMPGKVEITPDGYEKAMQVNYLSTRRLTELLAPHVADGGAIVFTTSVTRHLGGDPEDAVQRAATRRGFLRRFVTYGQSKRLITRYAHTLGQQLAARGVRVNCADPGIADTGIITMGNKVVDALATWLFRPIIYTAEQGAVPAIKAVDSKESGLIYTYKKVKRNDL